MENIARKNVVATRYRTRDLQITSQIRYQLSYPAGSQVKIVTNIDDSASSMDPDQPKYMYAAQAYPDRYFFLLIFSFRNHYSIPVSP